MYTFSVSLLEKKQICEDIFEFTFSINGELDFIFSPGQYIWLIIENEQTIKGGERRAFSIISSVRQKRSISILVGKSESRYYKLLFELSIKSNALVIGPFGSAFVINSNSSKKIIFISESEGISPFLSILRSRETYPNYKFIILCFSNQEVNIPYLDEVNQIAKENNFIFNRYTNEFHESSLPDGINYSEDEFFINGSKNFVDVVNKILTDKQVKFSQMHFEKYYPAKIQNLTEENFMHSLGKESILLQAVLDAKNHIIITDANGVIIFANNKAQSLTGFSFEEMRGNTPRLWGGMMPPEFYKNLWSDETQQSGYVGEVVNRNKNGTLYHVIAHISPIFSKDKRIIGFLGTEEDVTKKNENLKQLEYQNKIINLYKNRLGAIISYLGEAVVVIEMDKKISLMNQFAIRLVGKDAINFNQKDFDSICKIIIENDSYCLTTQGVLHDIFRNSSAHSIRTNAFLIKNDNSKIPIAFTANPFFDDYNGVVGYILLFRDITEEKEVDKMKSEFVSIASHQLRTPLSGIQWITELLLNNKLGELNTHQKQFIEKIAESNKKLITLVNDLLNVSRIDSPKKFIANRTIQNFVKFLNDLVEEEKIVGIPNRINIEFINQTNLEDIQLNIDVEKIKQAFNNLLSNVIKYSEEGDTVTVGIEKVEESFVYTYVKDTGIGIPEDQKSKIFDKFFRGDNVGNIEGTGLGLYLVQSIIKLHNGLIWFESEENQGTTFHIKLPLN